MLSLVVLAGIWSTSCVQMQSNTNQGFARETYTFTTTGEYEFSRQWFIDGACANQKDVEETRGSVTLGSRLSGMFINGITYAADFSDDNGTDLGAIALHPNTNSIRVARGMKNSVMRNTMVGIFDYTKQ